MQKPSVGQIVHIIMPYDDDFEPVPAIILSVPSDEFVSLKVFKRDGTDSLVTARWSEEPKLGHWSWPPRV